MVPKSEPGSQITYVKPEFLATFVSGTGAGTAFTAVECSIATFGLLLSPMDLAGGGGALCSLLREGSCCAEEVKHEGPIAQKDSLLSLSYPEMALLKLFLVRETKVPLSSEKPSPALATRAERRG